MTGDDITRVRDQDNSVGIYLLNEDSEQSSPRSDETRPRPSRRGLFRGRRRIPLDLPPRQPAMFIFKEDEQ